MAFLHNTYLLIDFGDFVDGQDGKTADPYIQLSPVTNMTNAHHDFVTVWLSGEDHLDTQQKLLSFGQSKKSPEPDPNSLFFFMTTTLEPAPMKVPHGIWVSISSLVLL